jgi:ABC-type glycerol-3-phosphate transport system substrate-binding protein
MLDGDRSRGTSGTSTINRRQFIQATGASGVVALMAGCSGDGNTETEGSDTDAGGGGDDSNDGGTTDSGSDDLPYEDVTFEWWDIWNKQSSSVSQFLKEQKQAFEEETGATIEVNWSGYGSIADGTWVSNFQEGNYPVLASYGHDLSGQFHEGGWATSFAPYFDRVGDDVMSQIEWQRPGLESGFRGYGGDILQLPVSMQTLSPLVIRTDHFEQAGLDPDSDFPPEDYEELIQTAKTLQSEGPGNVGFQPLGAQYDAVNTYNVHWSVALNGADGLILNDDYSDTLLDTQAWKDNLANYVGAYTEHDLGTPGTPAASDEDQVANLASGNVSMSYYESPNHPTMMQRAPDLLEDDTLKYGPGIAGNSGQRVIPSYKTFGLMNAPDGVDENTWSKRQEAAADFAARFLQPEQQKLWPEATGFLPIREDMYSELDSARGPHNFVSSAKEALETVEHTFGGHPQLANIMFNTIQPYIQQAFQEKITPEEAAEEAAADVRELL